MTEIRRIPRYAVITTHNRPNELDRLVTSFTPQVDYVIIIDNASDPPVSIDLFYIQTMIIRDEEQPPNLYRLWNIGLNAVATHASINHAEWDVGLFNDDADVPMGWYDTVATALRSGVYAAASTASHTPVNAPVVNTQPGGALYERMCPWAFVTRGEYGLRADETFRWWYGDTDYEWRCRQNGGVIRVPGPIVANTLANSTTHGELAEQAGRDGVYFSEKWGYRPW